MEYLGGIFMTGEVVPETGQYQLLDNRDDVDPRDSEADVVLMFYAGEHFPSHPQTGGKALWRFVRVASTRIHEALRESDDWYPAWED